MQASRGRLVDFAAIRGSIEQAIFLMSRQTNQKIPRSAGENTNARSFQCTNLHRRPERLPINSLNVRPFLLENKLKNLFGAQSYYLMIVCGTKTGKLVTLKMANMERQVEIRLRHWVFVDEVKFFGPGRYELLERIAETGSIAQAAKEMGLSYKKAWAMVDALNTLGKGAYVVTQKGGTKGGGTVLTDTARDVMAAYKRLNDKLLAALAEEQELLSLI